MEQNRRSASVWLSKNIPQLPGWWLAERDEKKGSSGHCPERNTATTSRRQPRSIGSADMAQGSNKTATTLMQLFRVGIFLKKADQSDQSDNNVNDQRPARLHTLVHIHSQTHTHTHLHLKVNGPKGMGCRRVNSGQMTSENGLRLASVATSATIACQRLQQHGGYGGYGGVVRRRRPGAGGGAQRRRPGSTVRTRDAAVGPANLFQHQKSVHRPVM